MNWKPQTTKPMSSGAKLSAGKNPAQASRESGVGVHEAVVPNNLCGNEAAQDRAGISHNGSLATASIPASCIPISVATAAALSGAVATAVAAGECQHDIAEGATERKIGFPAEANGAEAGKHGSVEMESSQAHESNRSQALTGSLAAGETFPKVGVNARSGFGQCAAPAFDSAMLFIAGYGMKLGKATPGQIRTLVAWTLQGQTQVAA